MGRFIKKYAVIAISIWVAMLISDYVVKYLESFYKAKSYTAVLIGMLATVIIFYPVIGFIDKYVAKLSQSYMKRSKDLAKSNALGYLIGFIIAFIIIFALFANVWYDLDLIKDVKRLF